MSHDIKLFLVRHAESKANVDHDVYNQVANHQVPLSEQGLWQTGDVGQFLKKELDRRPGYALMLSSPYLRAQQTAERIQAATREIRIPQIRYSLLLSERNYGMFDGVPKADRPKRFPNEWAYYQKQKEIGGEFFAKLPMGESFFDVAVRVQGLFHDLHWEIENNNRTTFVIVAHAHSLRAFAMMWCQKDPEWFMAEADPPNASVRLLESGNDCGYVFKGFEGEKVP